MRTGLAVIGTILLVFGVLLYGGPARIFGSATTTDEGESDTTSIFASLNIPPEWGIGIALLGLVLLILGIVSPTPHDTVVSERRKPGTYTKEDVEIYDSRDGKTVRRTERTEKRT